MLSGSRDYELQSNVVLDSELHLARALSFPAKSHGRAVRLPRSQTFYAFELLRSRALTSSCFIRSLFPLLCSNQHHSRVYGPPPQPSCDSIFPHLTILNNATYRVLALEWSHLAALSCSTTRARLRWCAFASPRTRAHHVLCTHCNAIKIFLCLLTVGSSSSVAFADLLSHLHHLAYL